MGFGRSCLAQCSVVVLLALAACQSSSPAGRRRQEFLSAHPETSPEVRRAITEGEIHLGMTHPEVVASLGRFDNAGPDVSNLGDYHVRLYGPLALTFSGAEIENSVLIFKTKWGDDPMFRRVQRRIRAHDERRREGEAPAHRDSR